MIRTVFIRELLEMVSSWRFFAFAVILMTLGLLVTAVRSVDHTQRLKDYAQAESLQAEMLDGGMSAGGGGGLVFHPPRRPARMSPIAQGTQESVMERFFVSVYEDPLEILYPSADLLMVMGIVISLGALLLASDQICGEREAGTMRLTLANAVKRGYILTGKWLACLATLGTGILLLFLGIVLVLVLVKPDVWTETDWGSFVALFVFSLVYASAFLMIGLFLSVSTRQSGTAAILALMAWAIAVFVVPSLPIYLAREVQPSLSPTYATINLLRVEEERKEKLRKLRAPLYARGLTDAEVDEQVDSVAVRRIWEEFRQKRKYFDNASHERGVIQGLISAGIAQLSPYSAYLLGGAEVAGVGVASMASFLQFEKKQENAMHDYLEEKWRAEVTKNPDLKKSDRLDTSDRPRDVYKGESLIFRLTGMALPLLSLVIFNVLFFMLAWRKFMRYDVR